MSMESEYYHEAEKARNMFALGLYQLEIRDKSEFYKKSHKLICSKPIIIDNEKYYPYIYFNNHPKDWPQQVFFANKEVSESDRISVIIFPDLSLKDLEKIAQSRKCYFSYNQLTESIKK